MSTPDAWGRTPLWAACRGGRLPVLEWLAQKAALAALVKEHPVETAPEAVAATAAVVPNVRTPTQLGWVLLVIRAAVASLILLIGRARWDRARKRDLAKSRIPNSLPFLHCSGVPRCGSHASTGGSTWSSGSAPAAPSSTSGLRWVLLRRRSDRLMWS